MSYREKGIAVLLVAAFLLSSLVFIQPITSAAMAQDSWVTKAPMQQARDGLGVAVVDGKIYTYGVYHNCLPEQNILPGRNHKSPQNRYSCFNQRDGSLRPSHKHLED